MRLTSKSAPVTGRESAKGVVVNLREYMPQHWENGFFMYMLYK